VDAQTENHKSKTIIIWWKGRAWYVRQSIYDPISGRSWNHAVSHAYIPDNEGEIIDENDERLLST